MRIIIFLVLAAISNLGFSQQSEGVSITVVIPNLQNNEGIASAALYKEATFMRGAPEASQQATPENKTVTLVFKNVQPGDYGIVTLHDKNSNKRMDFEANGMPLEDYGISGAGAGAGFGPPTWADAKFTVADKDLTLEIKM